MALKICHICIYDLGPQKSMPLNKPYLLIGMRGESMENLTGRIRSPDPNYNLFILVMLVQ